MEPLYVDVLLDMHTSTAIGELFKTKLNLPERSDVHVDRANKTHKHDGFAITYFNLSEAKVEALQKYFRDKSIDSKIERAEEGYVALRAHVSEKEFQSYTKELGIDRQVDDLITKDDNVTGLIIHIKGEPTPSVTLYFNSPGKAKEAMTKLPKDLQADPATGIGRSTTNGRDYLTFAIKGPRTADEYRKIIRGMSRHVDYFGTSDEALDRFAPKVAPGIKKAAAEFKQWREKRAHTEQEKQAALTTSLADLSKVNGLPGDIKEVIDEVKTALAAHDMTQLRQASKTIGVQIADAVTGDRSLDHETLERLNNLRHQIKDVLPAEPPSISSPAKQGARGK